MTAFCQVTGCKRRAKWFMIYKGIKMWLCDQHEKERGNENEKTTTTSA